MSSKIIPPVPESSPTDRSVFRVNPLSHVVSGMLLLAVLGPVSVNPLWFGWLLLVPVAFSWWVARTSTRLDEQGVTLRSWRGSEQMSWEHIKGVMFPRRGFARLVTEDNAERTMGGVSFHDLPRLSQASRGRIADPYSMPAKDSPSSADSRPADHVVDDQI